MYIVLTCPEEKADIARKINRKGLKVIFFPTILFQNISLSEEEVQNLNGQFDWVIFTSKTAVRFFFENFGVLNGRKVGVIGTETAKELNKNGVLVDFVPREFTVKALADQVPVAKGERVLLPGSSISGSALLSKLKRRGVKVNKIPIYKTILNDKPNSEFEDKLSKGEIEAILFSSPSEVRGLFSSLSNKSLTRVLIKCRAVSIGPATGKTLKKFGFKSIYNSGIHNMEGMLKTLGKVIQ